MKYLLIFVLAACTTFGLVQCDEAPKEPFMCPTCDDCEDDNFTYESCTEAEDVGPDPVCVVLKEEEEDEPSYVQRFCESREKYNRVFPYCKSEDGCSLAMCEESRCKAELPNSVPSTEEEFQCPVCRGRGDNPQDDCDKKSKLQKCTPPAGKKAICDATLYSFGTFVRMCSDEDSYEASVNNCKNYGGCQKAKCTTSGCKAVIQTPSPTPAARDECQNYQTLTDGNRKNTNGASQGCDSSLGPAWFRFQGAAGTKMPTSCVPQYKCGTHAPGWLNGAHPTVAEGKVTRQVCFSWSKCCEWSINIQVRNCGDFFIYYIDGTPREHTCHLAYCGTD